MHEFGTPVGEVIQTWVYPVKGMQGVRQEQGIKVSSVTAAGDRRYGYSPRLQDAEDDNPKYADELDERPTIERIPSLLDTIKFNGLLEYSPYFMNPDNPKTSKVRVVTPDGIHLPARSGELREEIEKRYSEYTKQKQHLQLAGIGRGLYHSMPISLLSYESIAEIEHLARKPIHPQVFRENILVRMFSNQPFSEDQLLGMLLQFGNRETSAVLTAVKMDPRCATVNMDPYSGNNIGGILRAIEQNHNKELGIYCGVKKEGDILPKDLIYAQAA